MGDSWESEEDPLGETFVLHTYISGYIHGEVQNIALSLQRGVEEDSELTYTQAWQYSSKSKEFHNMLHNGDLLLPRREEANEPQIEMQ